VSTIELVRAFGSRLQGADGSFAPGLNVVLGTPADGTSEIAELCAGMTRPASGAVRIAGKEPWSSPATRARVGALLADEPPASAPSLARAVQTALALRGDGRDAGALLAEHGLAAWGSSRPARAPATIRRHVGLALALTVPSPIAVVLHEPFATGPLADREKTRARLFELAEAGVCVLVLTASPRDAAELGGNTVLCDRGRFVRRPGLPLGVELAPGTPLALRVRSADARRLAAALADHPAVESLELGGDQVVLRNKDVSALALAISDTARKLGVELAAIEPILPTLDEARAASAGLWRGAYEGALEAARAAARARVEAQARPRTISELSGEGPRS
jgi:ABC-2 type transport system ATP-binding protein